jgi:hypothetical protein
MRFMSVLHFESELSLCNSVCGEPEQGWRKAEHKARREGKYALKQFVLEFKTGWFELLADTKKTAWLVVS